MRTHAEAIKALNEHGDTVRRVCFLHLHNRSDVEDVFQEVFFKHFLHDGAFTSPAHEKAWLIRVCINTCKDVTKRFAYKKVRSLTDADLTHLAIPPPDEGLLDAVLRLPPKYRNVIYLHYYEGYAAVEIAMLLGKKENTVYSWLKRARAQLKKELCGMWDEP